MKRARISVFFIVVAALSTGCVSEFDKCVETKQDAFKREHPDENWENLVRARENFAAECQQ
jgi:hypothetical protein